MEEDPVAQATFAQRLKQLMELRDAKQADVIRMAQTRGKHLGKSQVSQYVSGKTIPRRDVMDVLAAVFEVDAEWLATGKGPGPDAARATKPGSIPAPPARPIRSDSASHTTGGAPMRTFKKSNKLDNVLYDVRGPVVDEAARMEDDGARILKLNIGNPAPFGFRAPDEVVFDMRQQLADCEGYSDSRGLFSARKAIMQYSQLRNIPNVDMKHIYTGNGVSELIQLSMHALIDNGDEVLVPSPDYPRDACRR